MNEYASDPRATAESWAQRSLTAFFDDADSAQDALMRLREAGIPDDCVTMTRGQRAEDAIGLSDTNRTGGFFEALGDFFFPDDDRIAYAEGLKRGGHLITVRGLSEHQADVALDILDDEGAVDMDERTASWRNEGWTGSDVSVDTPVMGDSSPMMPRAMGQGGTLGSAMAGSGMDSPSGSRTMQPGDDETIEVVEERLRVGKRDESQGRVRVRSYVVEEPVSEQVTLREERVDIERRPVDRPTTGVGAAAFTDRTIEAEAYREKAVVNKEARVVEEIALRKTSDQRTETISDTVRHTEVEIEDDRDDSLTGGAGIDPLRR